MVNAILTGLADGFEYGAEPWIGTRVFHGRLTQWVYDRALIVGDRAHMHRALID